MNVTGYTYATAGKPHRLTSVTIGGVGQTLSYNSNGSITQYDAASGNDTFLAYDGQNNVQSVTVGVSAGTTTPKAKDEFWYTPDGNRFLGRETWDASGVQRIAITTYLGAFEEVKPSAESSYNLFRRVQVTPTVMWKWRSVAAGGTATDWVYQHRDHLGSMDAMTDGSGALVSSVVGKTSFDPFGGRRSKDWSKDITPAELQALLFVDYEDEKSPRGFTDHEQLNRTGFIHMNGRVYDPRIGRFVSADPIVQEPTFSQSYNRYAYVMNNPVSYTDPSGFYNLPPNATVYLYNGGEAGGGQNGERSDQIHCDEIAPSATCYEFDSYREFRDVIQKPVNELIRTLTTSEAVEASIWVASIGSGLWESAQAVVNDPGQYLPPAPQGLVDAVAGFGDGASLGVTVAIRELMGTNHTVEFSSSAYLGGTFAGIAVTTRGYATGAELSIGRNFRLAPWGNRTGNPHGKYPHYHRRGAPDASGKTPDGQGIGRHRPWETKRPDTSFFDRF